MGEWQRKAPVSEGLSESDAEIFDAAFSDHSDGKLTDAEYEAVKASILANPAPIDTVRRARWKAPGVAVVVVAAALILLRLVAPVIQDAMTPRFEKALGECKISTLLTLADEGKTISMVVKPENDAGKRTSLTNFEDLACALKELEVPSYVVQHIDSTRALDGQQTDEWDGITARWTYHPDAGLKIVLMDR